MSPSKCIFCEIVAGRSPADIVYEDDTYLAFKDKWPASRKHIQVIPKRHIKNVLSLSPSDARLVEDLLRIGCEVLGIPDASSENTRFGFHVPPFTSVSHLQCVDGMHAMELPFTPSINRFKFSPKTPLWFLPTERLLARWGISVGDIARGAAANAGQMSKQVENGGAATAADR